MRIVTKKNSEIAVRQSTALTKKKYTRPADIGLIVTIAILLSMGLIMVLSASAPSALAYEGDSYHYFKSQLKFACVGIGVMIIASLFDYKKLRGRLADIALIGSLVLMLLVFVPGVGRTIKGATRWIYIGFQFQPSEVMKIGLILFLAAKLSKDPKKNKDFIRGICPYLLVVGLVCVLLYLQPHYSALGIIVAVAGIMILVSGVRIRDILVLAVTATPLLIYFLLKADYRLERVMTFLDPWQDMLDSGWQAIQSLYAVGSGGLFGVGLGNSTQKYMYIPEPQNDFIFSIWAEETGFIGVLFVLILFGIFIWRGITIALRAPDMFGTLLAIGITSLVGVQALLNIAIVCALFPVTGIPLPFFSYGGTALVILLASCGVLLNISKQGTR
ncbi:MAG: putative lipid II flippase FtsW [Clostridia bacterium]|nr:putative lipid II flippase FtsW [Clostridia bacterium]